MGVVYKITCNNDEVSDCYVGSTTNFTKRQYQHKSCASRLKNNLYSCIADNGGRSSADIAWTMEVVDTIDDDDRLVLLNAEKYWINKLKPSLNTNKVLPTTGEIKDANRAYQRQRYQNNKEYFKERALKYREEHPEEYKAYQDAYRAKNKETLNCRMREKYTCECGGRFTYVNRIQHLKTKKHLNYCANSSSVS